MTLLRKIPIPRNYLYTGKYSWTKVNVEKRAIKARKAGYNVKIIPAVIAHKRGYALFAQYKHQGNKNVWIKH